MLFGYVLIAVFLADQASKMFIMSKMTQYESIPVITDVFHITYIHNPGAAFGIMANRTFLFIAVSFLVVLGIIVFQLWQGPRKGLVPVSLGLIAGGAAGNLADRIRFGEVVDFLDFRVWPVFNLADTAIVIGAGLLIIYVWQAEKQARRR